MIPTWGKPKYSLIDLSQCYFVYQKSKMEMRVKTFGLLNENRHIWIRCDTTDNYIRQYVVTSLLRLYRSWRRSFCMPFPHFHNRNTRTEVKCILQDTLLLGVGRWTLNNDCPRNSFSYADCDRKKGNHKMNTTQHRCLREMQRGTSLCPVTFLMRDCVEHQPTNCRPHRITRLLVFHGSPSADVPQSSSAVIFPHLAIRFHGCQRCHVYDIGFFRFHFLFSAFASSHLLPYRIVEPVF